MPIEQSTRGSNMDYHITNEREPEGGQLPRTTVQSKQNNSDPRRKILLNQTQKTKYTLNDITTAKYNMLSFFPKFLFEQFRRYANVFFLCIGLLQQIPNVSPTGRFVTIVPFSIILGLTAIKELIEDFKRHRADGKVNNSKVQVLDINGTFETKAWKQITVGDIVKVENGQFFPADLVLLASSEPQAMCYIETSNLDGETNLKIRSGVPLTSELDSGIKMAEFRGIVECEPPNKNLYDFKGNIKSHDSEYVPIDPASILLRGAKLMNTHWVFGIVVYSGHETKLLMNSNQAPLKRSNIDKITNYQIIFLFFILVIMSLVSAGLNEIQKHDNEDHSIYLGSTVDSHFFYNFLTFIILYNNLIPISLQVTLEMVKFIQAYFINWDEDMVYEGTSALARTSNLNEELGQIKYIFSDKTGTLTRNIMEFKQSSIAGDLYAINDNPELEMESDLINNFKNGDKGSEVIKDFLVLMAVCHTVIPEYKDGELFYNASSPDEKALVEGAARYGFKFVERQPEHVIITTPKGTEEKYEVLDVIEFTSTRKRMTVIVRCPSGEIKLLCKGADTMIMERLGNDPKIHRKYQDVTIRHLEYFACEGLRTLCLAKKVISEGEYESWESIYHQATTDLENKQEEIEKAAELVEKDMTLLGATAIEDKLQEGVPETIHKLLEAGIHVWVLTGDKQETAINIGHSCKLLSENMPMIIINTNSLDDTRSEITEHLNNFRNENAVGKTNDIAVIVDGKSLTYALDQSIRKDFLDLCSSCQSVICCRVSPLQKAEMVELVQDNTGSISLAIGDGANDVAMIQKADVGVGISGNEGLQAANSSDFAVAQFRFLSKLLLVHGAWNYTRISKLILYCFYKNICLYIIELWFAIYNYWSGQVLFERWTIGLYNIFFTSWPPIAIGLFDQCCTAEARLRYPTLYHSTQNSEYFNHRVFWFWIGKSIVHSMILFWLPMFTYDTGIAWGNGRSGDYLVLGNMVYTFVVIVVCCKAGMELDAWNWLSHMSIWGSIIFWFVFLAVYSYCWPLGIDLAANMAGMSYLVFSSPMFWFLLAFVPFTTLMPDIIFKTIKTTVYATKTDKIRATPLKVTETSSLLKNVRKIFSRHSPKRQREELELSHGYAFSQEEDGAVSQVEFIRRYTAKKSARSNKGGYSNFLPSISKKKHSKESGATSEEGTIKKSLFVGNSEKTPRACGEPRKTSSGINEETVLVHYESEEEKHAVDHPDCTKNLNKNQTLRLTAKHSELPGPQSPTKVDIQVTKTRTNKSFAQNKAEITPLTSQSPEEEG